MRRAWAAAIAITALCASRAAYAGPDEQRLAQALFDEARRLMEQKRYAEACPKLAESQRLDPGGGTLLNLAVCHAAEGKTATALVEYNEALAAATRDGRRDREELARAAIGKLENEVPRVTVSVPRANRVPGLDVHIDDTALPSVAWDVPMPVDPGAHAVVASIPGRAPWKAVISVLPGEKKTIEIPQLLPAPPEGAPPTMPSTTTPSAPHERPPPPEQHVETSVNPLFIGTLALTIAAGGTMVVTGLLASSERSKAEGNCIVDRNFCRSAGGREAADASTTLAYVSTTALVITAVGVIALFIVPTRKVTTKTSASALFLETSF